MPSSPDRQNEDVIRVGFEFPGDTERQIDDVVLIVAAATDEKLFAFLQHADHAKLIGANLDCLADRRTKLEKIVRHL